MHAQAVFLASGRTYGSRRLSAALRAQGHDVGRHRCRTLMKACGLKACWRRKFAHTTDSKHHLPVAENVLNRQFEPEAPNTAWVCDVTYIRTDSGWLYLAAVLDLYSRRIVGWSMAPTMPAQLVCDALSMAISVRQPAPGLLVHSDRGSQYASAEHRQLLENHGLVLSMSRKGNCWDNAVMERFFLNLKMERVWQTRYANHTEAKQDITDYIVNFITVPDCIQTWLPITRTVRNAGQPCRPVARLCITYHLIGVSKKLDHNTLYLLTGLIFVSKNDLWYCELQSHYTVVLLLFMRKRSRFQSNVQRKLMTNF